MLHAPLRGPNCFWGAGPSEPAYLAANKERTAAFGRAWKRHVSPGEPIFWKVPQARAIVEAQRGEDLFDVTTQMRVLWQ